MKNKVLKVSSSILLIIAILLTTIAPVFADFDDPSMITPNDNSKIASTAQGIAGKIIGVIQVIGVGVAIIMLIILAIKYISAAPNDKAEIKKHAVVYVVGAVVLFAASAILEIIKQFAANIK